MRRRWKFWASALLAAHSARVEFRPAVPPGTAPLERLRNGKLPERNGRQRSAENLWVENYNDITEYNSKGKLVRTITEGIPYEGDNTGGFAFDSSGKMYVITATFNVSIYAAGFAKVPRHDHLGPSDAVCPGGRSARQSLCRKRNSKTFQSTSRAKTTKTRNNARHQQPDSARFRLARKPLRSEFFGNTVTVYSPAGDLIRTIQDGVYGPESIASIQRIHCTSPTVPADTV